MVKNLSISKTSPGSNPFMMDGDWEEQMSGCVSGCVKKEEKPMKTVFKSHTVCFLAACDLQLTWLTVTSSLIISVTRDSYGPRGEDSKHRCGEHKKFTPSRIWTFEQALKLPFTLTLSTIGSK